ncbi:hypothetical protein [Priestia megaterium]|uniref:hypothetical protein n=1 Tax=Priestia megaterium TaxID=1404 RepID=UPI000BFD8536|nr:hypothetical protein [Priestia megaterium]PGQ88213.1 hypothetical protein COA18_04620 [Priestia megaterium]
MTSNSKKQLTKINGGMKEMTDEQSVKTAVATVKAMNFKESNEQDVKMAEVVMSHLTEQKKLEHEIKLLEMENAKLMQESLMITQKRQVELEAKYKVINRVSDAAVAIGTMAAIATITCTGLSTMKEVQIEELRLGMEE